MLNHPNTSDQLRRSTEASLLHRKQDRLLSIPPGDAEKERLRKEVMEMVDGMVLLQIPNQLAWSTYFETRDLESLRMFCNAFEANQLNPRHRTVQFDGDTHVAQDTSPLCLSTHVACLDAF